MDDGARRLVPLVGAALERAERGLAERTARLDRAARSGLEDADRALEDARARLVVGRPAERLAELGVRLETDARRLVDRVGRRLEQAAERLEAAAGRARLLDPRHVLRRGFAWLRDERARLYDALLAMAEGIELPPFRD